MKPFSTPVLSKRTYRELKLLKHLRHENVRMGYIHSAGWVLTLPRSSVSAISLSHRLKTCQYIHQPSRLGSSLAKLNSRLSRYFVTELLGTDLHRLLTSRPLEKQFIQYFLYQILVGPRHRRGLYREADCMVARTQICAFGWGGPPGLEAKQHPRKRELRSQNM